MSSSRLSVTPNKKQQKGNSKSSKNSPADASKSQDVADKISTEPSTKEVPVKRKGVEKKEVNSSESVNPNVENLDQQTDVNKPSLNVEDYMDEILNWIKNESKVLRETAKKVHEMRRAYNLQIKELKKSKGKRHVAKATNRTPSGFASSSKISEALCDFLNLEHGTLIARTLVAKKVINYIKDNNLEEPDNKRIINPDDALEKLVGGADERLKTMKMKKQQLKLDAEAHPENKKKQKKYNNCEVTDKLTYFNLPLHLNKQFIKAEGVPTNNALESQCEQASVTV